MSLTASKLASQNTALTQADILPYGDGAYLVQFPTQIYDAAITERIRALNFTLSKSDFWDDIVTGYTSLLVSFNPQNIDSNSAYKHLKKALHTPKKHMKQGRTLDIPVCYGGIFGPDLDTISTTLARSHDAIISLHSQPNYHVCMMGFIPGFTFLSEAPKALHHARHATPRFNVPAGSVGIAGWQTGIYGLDSPGGWQIIGRTPYRIFEPERAEPFLLESGDTVKFRPISETEFHALCKSGTAQ